MSGPYFSQGRTRFFLSKTHEKAAFTALMKLNKRSMLGDHVEYAVKLEEALKEAGVAVHRDEKGNIDNILIETKCFAAVDILDALAPFVRKRWVILLSAISDGEAIAHVFDGVERHEEAPEDHLDETEDYEALWETPTFEDATKTTTPPTWKKAKASMTTPARAYAVANTYSVGDWIDHTKLGRGLVIDLIETTKVLVRFETGDRVLLHRT